MDDALIELAKKGEPAALEEVFRALLPMIRSIAGRYSSCGAEYEDLVQTGAVGLLKAIRGYDPNAGAKLTTYAFSMITGEIRHSLRAEEPVSYCPDPDALPAQSGGAESAETRLYVRELMDGLCERERKLMLLRYVFGFTQAETAARIGLSQPHVSKLERTIIMKLRARATEE